MCWESGVFIPLVQLQRHGQSITRGIGAVLRLMMAQHRIKTLHVLVFLLNVSPICNSSPWWFSLVLTKFKFWTPHRHRNNRCSSSSKKSHTSRTRPFCTIPLHFHQNASFFSIRSSPHSQPAVF